MLRRGPLTFIKEWRGMGIVELRRKLYEAVTKSGSGRIQSLGITREFISQPRYDAFDLYWALINANRGGWHRIFADWVQEHPEHPEAEEQEEKQLALL